MSIDARNISMIFLGWFQHTYFLVIITSFITSHVILSLYLIHPPYPVPLTSHITTPCPRLSPPPAQSSTIEEKDQRAHFLFSLKLLF